jgi:hypothetical protein
MMTKTTIKIGVAGSMRNMVSIGVGGVNIAMGKTIRKDNNGNGKRGGVTLATTMSTQRLVLLRSQCVGGAVAAGIPVRKRSSMSVKTTVNTRMAQTRHAVGTTTTTTKKRLGVATCLFRRHGTGNSVAAIMTSLALRVTETTGGKDVMSTTMSTTMAQLTVLMVSSLERVGGGDVAVVAKESLYEMKKKEEEGWITRGMMRARAAAKQVLFKSVGMTPARALQRAGMAVRDLTKVMQLL